MKNWPKSNMNLDTLGNDNNNFVEVQNTGVIEKDFYRYANNFNEAGDEIMKHIIESQDISKLDIWYFALIYLYRQSLELMLKANIFKVVQDENDRKSIIGLVRHDLKEAFNKLVEITGIDINSNDNLIWLSKFLEDISNIDRESDMFRYPFSNNMSVLFEKQTHIALDATYYNMYRAFDILSEYYNNGKFSEKEYEYKYEPKLFIEGNNYYMESVVGYKYGQRSFYPYYSSYQECGDYLSELVTKGNKKHLFMPMCYMFRNAIELGLKRIIVEDSKIDNEKRYKILKRKKHSILGLWNSVVDEIKLLNTDSNNTTLDDVIKYINAFHNIDITSDLFRYPCNKEMESNFLSMKTYDVTNIRDCFLDLLNFLDCVSMAMSNNNELEEEINSGLSI